MTITGAQVKAARQLLGWSLLDLGGRALVSDATIISFEKAHHRVRPEKIAAMQRALEAAGVEFTNGGEPGVKLRNLGR